MIAGIVLAAGQSLRMGRPKAVLRVDGETFLQRAVRILREGGCPEVVVVVDPAQPVAGDDQLAPGVSSAWREGPGTEQIDSLRAGLRALPAAAEAAVVLPVDHPRVATGTVTALIEAFRRNGAPIVLPVYEGKRGHPVLFSSSLFNELLEGHLPEGARSVVHLHAEELEEVEVDDLGVLLDLDTPDEYEEHLGGGG